MDNSAEKKQNKYLMYMHAGSGNHGCEAIVRSLCAMTDAEVTLISNNIAEDKRYGLDSACRVTEAVNPDADILSHIYFYAVKKLTGHGEARMKKRYENAGDVRQYSCALSIGGDNYCYDDALYDLRMANSMFNGRNLQTALIGCSIEPGLLKDSAILDDLKRYRFITARETITYNALREAMGQCGTRIMLIPDPAFTLPVQERSLPDGFADGHTVGINVSPMILNYEKPDKPGIILENYKKLIETVLKTTDDKIALIPHVVCAGNDDREPLRTLYDCYKDSGRILMADDCSACEMKYIISRCRIFIGARTHATIAAYSTCVPTLVVGYSVKSRGIATDIFGSDEGYVYPVQSLREADDLAKAYLELEEKAAAEREYLVKFMPAYIERARETGRILSGKADVTAV